MKRLAKTIGFLAAFVLLSNSMLAQHAISKKEQHEIKRLLKSLQSDLKILRSQDAGNYYNFISYGELPDGKIAVLYTKVDSQLSELKEKWAVAEKVYSSQTKKIVKALSKPAPKKPKVAKAKKQKQSG